MNTGKLTKLYTHASKCQEKKGRACKCLFISLPREKCGETGGHPDMEDGCKAMQAGRLTTGSFYLLAGSGPERSLESEMSRGINSFRSCKLGGVRVH